MCIRDRHMPTAFLPLATAFESLAQRRASGGIDAVAVQRALGLRSLFLADRLLVALGGGKRRFETPEEFITVAQKMMAAPGSPLGGRVLDTALNGMWLTAFVAVNVALFAWAFLRYREAGANLYIQ